MGANACIIDGREDAFSKQLKRLMRDAIRLGKADFLSDERFASRRARLDPRLAELFEAPSENRNVNRLQKRLRRYQDALFTFLDHPGVPSDNNHAEREIRPAVIMRKNSLANRSQNDADVQAILMSGVSVPVTLPRSHCHGPQKRKALRHCPNPNPNPLCGRGLGLRLGLGLGL